VCEWDDFIDDGNNTGNSRQSNQPTTNLHRSNKVAHKAIEEDPLLEDMCEIAGMEADRDAERITQRDKQKLLSKLSVNQATEKYFRNEQAFSNFVDNQQTMAQGQRFHSTLHTTDTMRSGYSQLSVNKQRSTYGAMSRHSNQSRMSTRQSNMSMGRGHSRISQQGSNSSFTREKRVSNAYDMGMELARQRESGESYELICGCIKRRKAQSITHQDVEKVDKVSRPPKMEKQYGLEQFENDMKKRRLKNKL